MKSRSAEPGIEIEAPARPLDNIEVAIIRELSKNGRISFAELAEKIHVSRATAYTRFQRLQEDGIIRGFSVQVDPKKMGFGISALVAAKVEFHSWRSVRDKLEAMPEVQYYAVTSGEFDAWALVRAPSMQTMRDVLLERLNDIPGIESTTTYFVFDEIVPKTVLFPDP